MINLRYHIVSLTAVFLALGIGVLLGGTYLDKYMVDQLDQSIRNAEERIRETRAENDRLRGEIGDAEAQNRALLDVGTDRLFGAQLIDVPVVVVAAEGTDETVRRNIVRAITNSGADFRGTLTLTAELDDLDDAGAVAEALDLDASTPAAVRAELIELFGAALAEAGAPVEDPEPEPSPSSTTIPGEEVPEGSTVEDPVDPDLPSTVPVTGDPAEATVPEDPATVDPAQTDPEPPEQPEVVTVMLELGLISHEPPTRPSGSGPLLSGAGYRFLFLSGDDAALPEDVFILPVLSRMADAGAIAAVVSSPSPGESGDPTVVSKVRSDAELSRLVSTVDNVESFNGIASSVLALDEIGRGVRGHYGQGRGAAEPMPTGA